MYYDYGDQWKINDNNVLYEVLLNQKKDVRLIGNISNPVLSEKK